jgi:hypothetical protein
MNFLLNITPWPVLSALLWIVLVVSALYFARPTAHKVIFAAGNSLHKMFRTASVSVTGAEKGLANRNREVLLAAGREAKERIVEREFDRINETVRKDLSSYASLHRSLSESINRIDKIDSREGRVGIGNVLSDIHKSLVKAHKEAMVMYHEASGKRHELLRKMRPEWRQIQQTLGKVGKNVDSLLSRSVTIDRHMQEYEDIVKGEDHAVFCPGVGRSSRWRHDQLLADRKTDGRDGWRNQPDRRLQDCGYRRPRYHYGRDFHGLVPDGVIADYSPVSGNRRTS